MGLAATIARRSLLRRPARTIFSILGVAVGIATVVGVYTLDHNTILARGRGPAEGIWKPDLEVRPKRGLRNPGRELEAVAGVDEVTAFFRNEALFVAMVPGGGPANRLRVKVLALEAHAAERLDAYRLLAGRHIEPDAKDRQVLVGEKLAERFGLAPGDTVHLSKPPRAARRVCREGEFEVVEQRAEPELGPPYAVVGVLAYEKVGREAKGDVVVVDYQRGLELYEGAFVQSSYWVKKDPAVDLERLQAGLRSDYSYEIDRRVVVGQKVEERAFRNGVFMAGLLAMLLGLYVIFHTLSISLVERIREVGVLHALGCSRRQVARIFFVEAVLISVLAGGLGLGGGLLMARFMLLNGMTTLGVDKHIHIQVFDVPWAVVLPLVAVGVGIALLGSVYPLVKARHTDTVAALRGDEPDREGGLARGFHVFAALLLAGVLPALYFAIVPMVGERQRSLVGVLLAGVGITALFVGLPLIVPSVISGVCQRVLGLSERIWPLSGKLAMRSVQQSRTRIAASIAAIALVTAAFVGLKGLTNSLRAEVEEWAAVAVENKVWVQNLPDLRFDEIQHALAPYDEVLGVEPRIEHAGHHFLILGVKEGELARYGPCAQRPELMAEMAVNKGMIVSERLARRMGYVVGDVVQVKTPDQGVHGFTVVAISDAYGYFPMPDERLYGVVSDVHLRNLFCIETDTVERMAVRLKDGSDEGIVEAVLGAAFPQAEAANYKTGSWVLRWHVEDITRDFVLFDVILGLTALLACIGVLNGQLLAALERSKELGVLRALGMSRGQLAGTVLLESAVVGSTGGLLGLALGSALTPVIVSALQEISGLALPHRTAGVFLGLCLLGALALTALAGLYPIWRMNRLDAVSAVRTG